MSTPPDKPEPGSPRGDAPDAPGNKPRNKPGNKPADKPAAANFRAFTLKADKPLRRIRFHVGITRAMPGDKGVAQAQLTQYQAVLDTGAERSRVSRRVIEAQGLAQGNGPDAGHGDSPDAAPENGQEEGESHGTGHGAAQEKSKEPPAGGQPAHYKADIYLPNMIRFAEVPVTEIPPDAQTDADCLIGMDILSCADCCLSHKDKKMMFSFRVPPLGATDFVEEHRRLHKGAKKMVTTAATRNQPCPCGSGKRFKNCCGKIY